MKDNVVPLAYRIEDAPAVVGVSRTRIFEAVRKGELKAHKAGRASIIMRRDLLSWIRSLPVKVVPIRPSATQPNNSHR
jgi:excisionase family DNA binding protein